MNNGTNYGPVAWNANNALSNANWNYAARDYPIWRLHSFYTVFRAWNGAAERLLRRCGKYSMKRAGLVAKAKTLWEIISI